MKIKYRYVRLNKTNRIRLELINQIIEEYQAAGYRLTLRQLYYQLVSRDVIPNKLREYAKLSVLLREGRMGGVVDWDAIEDRLRVPDKPASFEDPTEIILAAHDQYMLPRQKDQPYYLEVWVEKDALSGVLSRVTRPYHVPIMVNRGYSSVSAMHDAFHRFLNNGEEYDVPVRILYLGDHDPSGLDMIRDITDRINEFWLGYEHPTDLDFEVVPIALTQKQIRQYNPPPNPAKISDPRAANYINEYGTTSWEVDALKPEVLHRLLDDAITSYMDMKKYNAILDKEVKDKKKIKKLIDHL